MTSSQTINDLADQVESVANTGHIWSLRLGTDIDADERALLLDTHGRVLSVLRSRGHRVKATVVTDDDQVEHLTIRVMTGASWQAAPGG